MLEGPHIRRTRGWAGSQEDGPAACQNMHRSLMTRPRRLVGWLLGHTRFAYARINARGEQDRQGCDSCTFASGAVTTD
jgi:hypothetical protein